CGLPGGGQGPRYPGAPKSFRPSLGAASPSSRPPAPAAATPHASQCVNGYRPASGSSTQRASEPVPSGGAVHSSGGETSSPSHVNRSGIGSPSANAALVSSTSLVVAAAYMSLPLSFSARRRSISSEAAPRVGGNRSPVRLQSSWARA